MSPKVDFYILNNVDAKAYFLYACRILEKAYVKNNKVYVYMRDEASARRMDDTLWTFHDVSFIPHRIVGDSLNDTPPIEIGFGSRQKPACQNDVLMNLSDDVPDCWKDFSRIVEVVNDYQEAKEKSREKYKKYKALGLEIDVHK